MNKDFLFTLLDSMSVSGHEIPMQKNVIAEMTPHCDKIITDYTGNVISVINPDASFKVLLAGHIDEIGLVITNIQSDGMIRVTNAGGIRACTYPGHQVVLYGANGPIYGSVVRSKGTDKSDLKAGDRSAQYSQYMNENGYITEHTFNYNGAISGSVKMTMEV